MLRGEEPNKGACFVHRINAAWDPSRFEVLSKDGCDVMQFDTTGTILAVLGRNTSTIASIRPTYLSFWDFTISPQYVNYVEIPRKLRPFNIGCTGMVWSHCSDRLAITFVKKSYRRQNKVKDTSTDLVIIDSKMCTISRVFQVPFIAICTAFLPCSSDHLAVSDGSGCSISVIDIKEGTVIDRLTQTPFYIPEYILPSPPMSFESGNDQFFECSLAADANEKLEKWMNAHDKYVDLPFHDSSSFITISSDLASQFESESSIYSRGFLLSIEDDREMKCAMSIKKQNFSHDNGLPDGATQKLDFPSKCFTDTVYDMYVDDRNYTVLLISSTNSVVLSLLDLSLVWCLQEALINSIHNDVILVGGGFVPEIRAVIQREDGIVNEVPKWNLIVAFSSKDDFGFAIIMQVVDLYDPEGPKIIEEMRIPKFYGLTHLECCKHIALVLGQSSGDELFFLKKSLMTDFAGSMYPSGFKIMKTVRAYMEKEDELDKIVQNEDKEEGKTRVVSESFMKNTELGDYEGKNLLENDMSVLPVCTVIGDTNVEKEEVAEDVEVDIFNVCANSSITPSPGSVVDITSETTKPRPSWTTEDFNYFVPTEGNASLGPVSNEAKKNKSNYSTNNSSAVSDTITGISSKVETTTLLANEVSTSSSLLSPPSSSAPDMSSNTVEGRLCIDYLLPIPMSIRGGQFVAKIMKEKKLAEDIEKNRMRKTLIEDKITNYDKLYREETVKRKERDLIRREKAKEMEEKRRLQKIETTKRRREKKKEEREKRQKIREEFQRTEEVTQEEPTPKFDEDKRHPPPIPSTEKSSTFFDVPKDFADVDNGLLNSSPIASSQALSFSYPNTQHGISFQPESISTMENFEGGEKGR